MSTIVKVGIADLNVVKGEDQLVTYALGSCVAICLYDASQKIAGMAHIMLPDSTQLANGAGQPMKFADTALDMLLAKMIKMGALKTKLTAKIAGGAQMFADVGNSPLGNIGGRNVIAVRAGLAKYRIPIVAEDTGKDYGRTCYFSAATGGMRICSALKGEWNF